MYRNLVLLWIAVSLPLLSFSQNIHPVLLDDMEKQPDAYHTVLVLLQDQVNMQQMEEEFTRLRSSKAQRAISVVSALKAKASETQQPLLRFLQEQEGVDQNSLKSLWVSNLIKLNATAAAIKTIASHPLVELVEKDWQPSFDETPGSSTLATVVPNGVEPALTEINADKLWRLGYTGYGTKVFVIDSGTDPTHPAVKHQFNYNNNRFSVSSTADLYGDICTDHGTAVTGAILGLDHENKDTIGVAFEANWMDGPAPLFDANGERCDYQEGVSGTIENLEWALDPDNNSFTTSDMPDVINNSWSFEEYTNFDCSNGVYKRVIENISAAGIGVIFSIGNSGSEESTANFPAALTYDRYMPLSVGATTTNNIISDFSSRGPSICTNGPDNIKPEVVAPGQQIRTAALNGSYQQISGTSFSAPYVSGAFLLLKEAFPGLSGRELQKALFETARDLGPAGEDNIYGNGVIDIFAAYNYLIDAGNTPQAPVDKSNDVVLLDATSRLIDCEREIQLELKIYNGGNTTLNEVDVVIRRDVTNQVMGRMTWQGELAPGETTYFSTSPVVGVDIGAYTVRVSLENPNGQTDQRSLNNNFKTDVFVTNDPFEPQLTASSTNVCEGGTVFLQAAHDGQGTIQWFTEETGGTAISEGEYLLVDDINETTEIYAGLVFEEKTGLAGPEAGSSTTLSPQAGLVFDAYSDFQIKSVKVIAEKAGPRIIVVRKPDGGTLQKIVNIAAGEQRIDLGFNITAGEDYEMVVTVGNPLTITTTNVAWSDYEVDGILKIKRSTGTVATFYSYFYDWEIEYEYPCGRRGVQISTEPASTAPEAQFLLATEQPAAGGETRFTDASAGAVSWSWNFGDGTTSQEQNPAHVFSTPGVYLVSLEITDGSGCSNLEVMEVEVKQTTATSEQQRLNQQIQVYPNPVGDVLFTDIQLDEQQDVQLSIIDLLGRVVRSEDIGRLQSRQQTINLQGLPSGTYLVRFQVGQTTIGKRIIKR